MINGCVKGPGDCGCDCHRVSGVMHIRPCCDKPAKWFDLICEAGKPCKIVPVEETEAFDKDRDPGDEDGSVEGD